jgi:hypothetical protein
VVATFAGTEGDDISVTIAWGDGNTSTGTLSDDGLGNFTITGSNTYLEEGAYVVAVQVDDLTATTSQVVLSEGVVFPVQDDARRPPLLWFFRSGATRGRRCSCAAVCGTG